MKTPNPPKGSWEIVIDKKAGRKIIATCDAILKTMVKSPKPIMEDADATWADAQAKAQGLVAHWRLSASIYGPVTNRITYGSALRHCADELERAFDLTSSRAPVVRRVVKK